MQNTSYYQTSSYSSGGGQGVESVVRSSLHTVGGENRVVFNGLTDMEGARAVARRLFDTYDRDRDGNINNVEVVPMIVDSYRAFNRNFTPSKGDIDAYFKVLDRNKDGRVNLQDIENICIRYLVAGQLETVEVRKEVVKRAAPKYTKEALQRLEVARRLFKMFDVSGDGNLGKDEVRLLLIETYKQMGMHDFNPTREDVDSFMELVDSNQDGEITLQDYEMYIVRSLKEAGIQIEEEGMRLSDSPKRY